MIPRVRVPRIMWGGLTARRVLTMEWIEGVKLTDKAAMDRNGLQIVDFVDIGIECSLRQLLAEDGGFFHADPHPGATDQPWPANCAYVDEICLRFAPMDEGGGCSWTRIDPRGMLVSFMLIAFFGACMAGSGAARLSLSCSGRQAHSMPVVQAISWQQRLEIWRTSTLVRWLPEQAFLAMIV